MGVMPSNDAGSAHTLGTQRARYRAQRRRRILIIAGGILAVALVLGLAFGVGLGVGLPKYESSPSSSSSSSSSDSSSSSNSTVVDGRWVGYQPALGTSWQINLESVPDTFAPSGTYALYDLDLFEVTSDNIQSLHNEGQQAICYFSAGTKEDYRPDVGAIPSAAIGKELPDWPGEFWLKTGDPGVRSVMEARMKMARDKGCDAVDPDNVDGYDNDNGVGLTRDDSIDYVKWLASTAHDLGLACGLKNAGEIVDDVLDSVQFSVQEQCVETNECAQYRPFVDSGKAVLHIEYVAGRFAMDEKFVKASCDAEGIPKFSTLLKVMALDGFARGCPEGRILPA